jgi:TolA-binding protein
MSTAAPAALYNMASVYFTTKHDGDKAETLYREVVSKYSLSEFAVPAEFGLGCINIMKGDIENAQKICDKLNEEHPDKIDLNAAAIYALGLSYESAGKWSYTLYEFRKLRKQYPGTKEAMESLLVEANHYKKNQQAEKAEVAFEKAMNEYVKVINKYKDGHESIIAHEFIIQAYVMQEKWGEAKKELALLSNRFPQIYLLGTALFENGSIYAYSFIETPQTAEFMAKSPLRYSVNKPRRSSAAMLPSWILKNNYK